MTPEPMISLELSVSQVNTVLMALNEAPYRVAAPLITSIMKQASTAQLASGVAPEA